MKTYIIRLGDFETAIGGDRLWTDNGCAIIWSENIIVAVIPKEALVYELSESI